MPVPASSICLFGTPGAELNLGVGALRDSTVHAIQRSLPDADITVFDDGWGERPYETPGGSVRLSGARASRRWHRPEAFAQMRAAVAVGGAGNPGARRVLGSSLVLDLSGGDSFSDLYGAKRYRTVAWPKRLALAAHRPLVLLPQTYGPFRDARLRAKAARLLRDADQVWSRDSASKAMADELIGADFTRRGVDMAFGLPVTQMTGAEYDRWEAWFSRTDGPVAGVNINGMLVNAPDAAARHGVTPNHGTEMARVASEILRTSDWRVVVVPHVRGEQSADSDTAICREVAGRLAERFGPERVFLADGVRTAGEAKSVISRCTWFTGARMHSTIAALSTGVPTGGVAYSLKMGPIFDDLDQPVVDARALGTEAIVDTILTLWRDHEAARRRLEQRLPGVLTAWDRQVAAIFAEADAKFAA